MSAAAAEPLLSCGNCREPMRRLALDGHYGATVTVDLCTACHLVWLDGTEGVRLAGAGMLALLDAMAEAQTLAHHALRKDAGCARCGGALKLVHNQSRWGRSTHLECRRGHGSYLSFAQFLADKGFSRPLSGADRATLAARDGGLHCLGCGAPIGARDAACLQCGALPALFDLGRLARALDPEGALEPQAVHATPAEHRVHDCPACGAPLPATSTLVCTHCGATVAVTRLAGAAAAVRPLADGLRSAAEKPPPHVVARRLAAVDANAGRQRAWAAEMEAQAAQTRAATGDWAGDDADDAQRTRLRHWAGGVVVALVLALLWLLA